MYLDTADFSTIWKLAHHWTGLNPSETDPKQISNELRETIYRIMSAISWTHISVRTRTRLILTDNFFLSILDLPHLIRFKRCLRDGVINPNYLDSLYIKRPEVIAWCEKEYLAAPSIWADGLPSEHQILSVEDDKDDGWYQSLTETRKKRVACLELAKRLWELKQEQTYEDVYNHPIMKQYATPKIFTFEAFKRWSKPYASEFATKGGRPIKNK